MSIKLMELVNFVLVRPQLGENIGSSARAMSNFGVVNMHLVSPRDGWPNVAAETLAAAGRFLLDKALVYSDLEEAILDANLVIAIEKVTKSYGIPYVGLRKLCYSVVMPSLLKGLKIFFIFGCESSGLTNTDISHADYIAYIDTDLMNPSLNLAQAVALVAYELRQLLNTVSILQPDVSTDVSLSQLATQQEFYKFLNTLYEELESSKFFRVEEKKLLLKVRLRRLFLKAGLTGAEVRLLYGMMKALINRVEVFSSFMTKLESENIEDDHY